MKREFKFYGWDSCDVSPVNEDYDVIADPKEMYVILTEIWSKDTCAPRLRDGWSKENMTLGQCSITAFLVQDVFGGEVYGIPREGGNFHCYNVVDGHVFDLTSEQFGDEVLSYESNPEQLREDHFASAEKYERYKLLKSGFDKLVQKHRQLKLIDGAARGDINAAAGLARGYFDGSFGEVNKAKAKKWASYAAKHGSIEAQELLSKL